MARMSAQDAAEVAKALGRQDQPGGSTLPVPPAGPGGIPGGIFRGKKQEGTAASPSQGLAATYVETGRTYGEEASATMYFSSDGMFRIGSVPLKTLTVAESNSNGAAVGSNVKITFTGEAPA